MSPIRSALIEFRDAAGQFSRPARLFLAAESLAWLGQGVFAVLFNLYLVQGGFTEAFVGRAISLNAFGIALFAWPAAHLADRVGRRRLLLAGAALDGASLVLRSLTLHPGTLLATSFLVGGGQAMLAVAAAPFITEHSTERERTHLFSSFFALALLSGVVGNMIGGWMPALLRALPSPWRPELLVAYRLSLLAGAAVALASTVPFLRLGGVREEPVPDRGRPLGRADFRLMAPIALNAVLIGAGAGLVIPFMNLYFARRFHCSSAQIGSFFSAAQVMTAFAALLGPAIARRYGKLRTAVASELLSLPFLVTLGAESHLSIAVGAFLMRATLMQAATPLINAFIMEVLPPELRARSTSLTHMLWNIGWALSATGAGLVIERFGYAVPFYCTAALYAIAALTFYAAFRRHTTPTPREVRPRDAMPESESGPAA